MVTKRLHQIHPYDSSLILAKIHMVTKLASKHTWASFCLILAKIHMVTKLIHQFVLFGSGLILAKIHMVTKQ